MFTYFYLLTKPLLALWAVPENLMQLSGPSENVRFTLVEKYTKWGRKVHEAVWFSCGDSLFPFLFFFRNQPRRFYNISFEIFRFWLSVFIVCEPETLHAGTKPRTTHHRLLGGDRRKKRRRWSIFLENTRKGHRQIRRTLELFQRRCWRNFWETRCCACGLFHPNRYHLQQKGLQLNSLVSIIKQLWEQSLEITFTN